LAALHETHDHPVGGLLTETMATLVYQDHPVWDRRGFEHEPVEP
jgi:hypothetical protein